MIGKQLKKMRVSRKISQLDLAKAMHVGRSTVSMWEADLSDPDVETIINLANFFDVSVNFLVGAETGETKSSKTNDDRNVTSVELDRTIVKINVYGTIPAGVPMNAIEDIIGTEEIPAAWLSGGREYFALKIRGDSMYPRFLEGDIVIFRKDSICETGDDCVVYINGEDATFKRVKLNDDGSLTLQPLNANYAPRTFSPKQIRDLPVAIGGVAVELRRNFNKK